MGLLSTLLVFVFGESLAAWVSPLSMHWVVLSPFPVRDEDPMGCSSSRPILLLSIDVEVLVGVLVGQLGWVVPAVVSSDQTGFVEGHLAFFSVRCLLNVLCALGPAGRGCDGVVLLLDAGWAFGWVEWI